MSSWRSVGLLRCVWRAVLISVLLFVISRISSAFSIVIGSVRPSARVQTMYISPHDYIIFIKKCNYLLFLLRNLIIYYFY